MNKNISNTLQTAKISVKIKRFFTPEIMVRMDGGISSQMHQYLLGRLFAERQIQVSYDLKWFKKYGKDMNGIFERNFELLNAFPTLEFHRVNPMEVFVYKKFRQTRSNYFDHENEDRFLLDLMPPKYLGDYYHSPKKVWTELFSRYFKVDPEILGEQKQLFEEMKQNLQSVAIHVRMGDLKDFNPAYGHPASIEYFQKAVDYFSQKLSKPIFYFFSDEPQLMRNELIEKLSIRRDSYKIVSSDESQKGFTDLFLISACAHQITSKGSLGKFGALLHDSSSKTVVLCDSPTEHVWRERLINPVFL